MKEEQTRLKQDRKRERERETKGKRNYSLSFFRSLCSTTTPFFLEEREKTKGGGWNLEGRGEEFRVREREERE